MPANKRPGRKRLPLLVFICVVLVGLISVGFLVVEQRRTVSDTPVDAADPETAADDSAAALAGPLGVGFVLSGFAADWGWGYQQIQGKLGLEARMRDQITTTFFPEIVDSATCDATLQAMCDGGTRLIFLLSDIHEAPCLAVASRNPDATFMLWYGTTVAPNVGTIVFDEGPVIHACGALAATNFPEQMRFGFVAPFPTRGIEWISGAFARGIRTVTPNATVDVRYTRSWYDPEAEVAAVEELAGRGIEVIYLVLISPVAAVQAADQAGMFVLSHFADLSSFTPEYWLTGTQYHWQNFFVDVTRSVLDGDWRSGRYGGGCRQGYLGLAPFGPAVTDAAKNRALEIVADISAGNFDLFVGPVLDNRGTLRVPAGEILSYWDFDAADWALAGVNELADEQDENPADDPD